jgi:hypothetical protein
MSRLGEMTAARVAGQNYAGIKWRARKPATAAMTGGSAHPPAIAMNEARWGDSEKKKGPALSGPGQWESRLFGAGQPVKDASPALPFH